jgi:hypothetical protein
MRIARISQVPKVILERELPEKDKQQLVFKFIREYLSYNPKIIISIWKLQKPNTFYKK